MLMFFFRIFFVFGKKRMRTHLPASCLPDTIDALQMLQPVTELLAMALIPTHSQFLDFVATVFILPG